MKRWIFSGVNDTYVFERAMEDFDGSTLAPSYCVLQESSFKASVCS